MRRGKNCITEKVRRQSVSDQIFDDYLPTQAQLTRAATLAMTGLGPTAIGQTMGVPYETWERWMTESPQLRKYLRQGEDVALDKVENALIQKGMEGDVKAGSFILERRRRDKWGKAVEVTTINQEVRGAMFSALSDMSGDTPVIESRGDSVD